MSTLLNVSIDLTKIEKTKIQTTDKNGQPYKNGAKYISLQVWINDTPDQYGNDASICHAQTLVEREAGAKKVYIGNGKISRPSGGGNVGSVNTGYPAAPAATSFEVDSDDLPF
jgi:hypothetical protein